MDHMRVMFIGIILLFAAALVGLGVAVVTVGDAEGSTGNHRVYVYPPDVQQARAVCYRAEREARNIPGEEAAYRVWWAAHHGTAAQRDWSAAYQACQDANPLPGGKWNWDAMIRVK